MSRFLPAALAALSFATSIRPAIGATRLFAPDTAWTRTGVVVCGAANTQGAPALANSSDGAYLVAWEDRRALATESNVYAQKLLGDGTVAPGWPVNGRACTQAGGDQSAVQVVSDGAGGLLAVWEDYRFGSSPRIYGQHLTSAGVPAAGWAADGRPVCATASLQSAPRMVTDGAGGALVFWEDYRTGQSRIYSQHVLPSGLFAAGWPDTGRAVAPAAGGQVSVSAAEDGAGGAWIAWCDGRSAITNSVDIYAQRLRGDGTRPTGWPAAGLAVCAAGGAQDQPGIAADGTGGAVLAWTDPRNGLYNIYGQRLTASGTPSPGWPADGLSVSFAAPGEFDPAMVSDGAGGLLVAWVDARGGSGNADIYAQRIEPDGSATWLAEGQPVCAASGDQLAPRLIHDGAGGAIVCWQDARFTPDTRLFAQRVTSVGSIAAGWPGDGRMMADTNLVVDPAAIIADGAGGAVFMWGGVVLPAGPSGEDIYAARVTGDGVVPALTALVSADAAADAVRIRWWTSWSGGSLTVERANDSSENGWRAVDEVRPAAGGFVDWIDRDVVPGRSYGYRLRTAEGPSAETWVTVPAAALALRRLGPNPAADAVTLAISLTGPEPASVEVFDLAGRRIEGHALAAPRTLTLDTRRWPPGIYLARLRQGGRVATLRFAIAR